MRKITKSDIRAIKWGDHDKLMESIEFLLDSYNEDSFDNGYKSCLSDLSVRSYNLAVTINKWLCEPSKGDSGIDNLAKVIEKYYTNALKDK
jgi:hypothetical protein